MTCSWHETRSTERSWCILKHSGRVLGPVRCSKRLAVKIVAESVDDTSRVIGTVFERVSLIWREIADMRI